MIQPADRLSLVSEYYFSRKLKEVAQMNAEGKDIISLAIGSPDMPPSEQTINKLGDMKQMDQSDLFTLRGFLDMVRIVQNPAQNGQRYYLSVMENFDKALKINPENALALQLQQKFQEGMKQAMKTP